MLSPHVLSVPTQISHRVVFSSLICFDSLISAKKPGLPGQGCPGPSVPRGPAASPRTAAHRRHRALRGAALNARVRTPAPGSRGRPRSARCPSVPRSRALRRRRVRGAPTALGTGTEGEGRAGGAGQGAARTRGGSGGTPGPARASRAAGRSRGSAGRPPGRGASGHRRIKAAAAARCACSARLGWVRHGAAATAT